MAATRQSGATHDDRDAPLKTLIVDDHDLNRLLMRTLLAELGCATTEATSGEEAARLARRTAFDFIVMDRNMPGLTGDETAARIRAKGASRRAFIARWTTDPANRAAAGLYDVELPKPVVYTPLVDAVAGARRLSMARTKRGATKRTPGFAAEESAGKPG